MNKDKITYSILKELEEGRVPVKESYGLDIETWGSIAEMIKVRKYVDSILIIRVGVEYRRTETVDYKDARLTEKGYDFLDKNTLFAKTYRGLKELRDWIKL